MEAFADYLEPSLPAAAVALLLLCGVLAFFLLGCLLRLRTQRAALRDKAAQLAQESKRSGELEKRGHEQQLQITRLETLLQTERKSTGEKLVLLEDARKNLLLQFQSLAQRIFEEKSATFGNENKERLTALLDPLQQQLHSFQQRINDIQTNDIRERTSLKQEILHLRELNGRITEEAANLARALRGDNKKQGSWGELVLERVLEKSGLVKGREYSVQNTYRQGGSHRIKRPDVVIRLPEDRHIIIDSKVSLSAWRRYIGSEDEQQQHTYLKDHIASIRSHVHNLSSKNYSELDGVNSLDFVLMFIPIDSSFAAASEEDEQLFADAYEQRIIIVTPTTLLATLKTIENLWRYERQDRNAREIAERAGAIYDKLHGFLSEMDKMGRQLSTCTATYESAMTKLCTGRGNILNQAERLTELGVKAKKKIARSIDADPEDDIVN